LVEAYQCFRGIFCLHLQGSEHQVPLKHR
jgi:hypothetical protein